MDPELLELLARINDLTGEELADLETRLREAFAEASGVEPPTSESVAQMSELRDAISTVTAEQTTREEAQAALEEKAAQLRAEVDGAGDGDEEGDEQTDGDEGDETPADGDTPAEGDTTPAEGETPAETTPEAVAASTTPPATPPSPRRAPLTGRRVPASHRPRPTGASLTRRGLVAAGDLPGISAGQPISSWADLAPAMSDKITATRGSRGEYMVASLHWDYDEAHTLDGNGEANGEKITAGLKEHEQRIDSIRASGNPDALVAAGGLCAPLAPYYELMVVSGAQRPVRDSLAQFGATRGGISYITPPKLGDLDSAVTQWTNQNDIDAAGGTPTKPCVRIACGTPTTVQIYGVPLCLEFGNIGARTFPEQVDANNQLGLATHARFAETTLLAAIDAGSTAVTVTADTYGAARSLLSVLSVARAGMVNRHRVPQNTKVRVILPAWARALLRTDIARQLATDASENDGGALAVTDAQIDNWLAVRNINVTWHEDGTGTGATGERFAAQAAGALLRFPTQVKIRMFLEGTWLFLDGGRLDVGIIRDSTLVSTNDYKSFFEVFEAVAKVGPESNLITLPVSPTGASGATVTAAAF